VKEPYVKRPLRVRRVCSALVGVVVVLWAASCAKAPTPPAKHVEQTPQTELTYAPVQYDTTTFRVHFYWTGYDDDGEVVRFHYAVDNDTLLPIEQWRTTVAKDTTLLFLVDPVQELKIHVFKVSAEDNSGKVDPTPASRAFSAKTIPPFSRILKGPAATNPFIGPNFTFEWEGTDPDGGETGGKAPVDSFQYLLLKLGGIADLGNPPTHPPLPSTFSENDPRLGFVTMIRAAIGDGLQPPHDDWKWQGIRGLKFRFRNVTTGEYVFAMRAVDIAGATEKNLVFRTNIRHFTVTTRNSGPILTVCSSILNRCLDNAVGPEDYARKQLQIFQGETVSFSWSGDASAYGGEIVGYTYALDDTTKFQGADFRLTGATFQPSQLDPGPHFLYVRAVDDGGLITNERIPLLIVHPAFKDAGGVPSLLFVDDCDFNLGNRSAPNDQVETDWWTLANANGAGPLFTLGQTLGLDYSEWDCVQKAFGTAEKRIQPTVSELAKYTTVLWATDLENGGSTATGLFRSVAGGDYSELQGYLRAGGTLILTGWSLAQGTSGTANLTFKDAGPSANAGVCASFAPNTRFYNETIFPRMYMGIDNSLQSRAGLRTQGASDFTRGIPTPAGVAFGFDTAVVDTGNESYGQQYPGSGGPQPTFKWNTNPFGAGGNGIPGIPDQQYFPGLAGIEGWYLARSFGCQPIQFFGYEDHSAPIVQVVYTYHGARTGDPRGFDWEGQTPGLGQRSPREGLAVGSFVQSHDLATSGGHYDPTAAVGRIAMFTFPLYYLRDNDAINIVRKSYDYVSQSPTLP
jgi:hypothetical protein